MVERWQHHFRWIRHLGRSHRSCVHLVRRRRDHKRFVLKEYNGKYPSSEDVILARLRKCPNAVRFKQCIWKSNDSCSGCFVFKYTPHAVTLSQFVKQRQFSAQEVVGVANQLWETLCWLHEHDIVHRDLKADNVLIRGSRRRMPMQITLIDFGRSVCRELNESDLYAFKDGRREYDAPELRRTHCVASFDMAKKADVYSAGVLLSELSKGCHDHLPPWFDRMLQSCLHPHPQLRWNAADAYRQVCSGNECN